MRDLKPDNLLVAGRKDNYPSFLAYPQKYKIGLIDVETAVILSSSGTKPIEQPPLGGTPQYASPSHFFPNSVLRRIYNDLPMTLHLQDWHGIIAIIYRIVTGLPLFQRAACSVTSTLREMGKYRGRELEHYHRINKTFWNIAVNEFREKIGQQEETFRSLNIAILQGARYMLREFAGEERSNIGDAVHHLAFHHTMPMSANDRQFLASCSYEKTKQLRHKWEIQSQAVAGHKIDRTQLITLLQHLELLKLREEQQTRLLGLLDHSSPTISAYELLEYMFSLVMRRMNRQTGEDVLPVESAGAIRQEVDISSETTIQATRQA
jgi:serine/threonine protein kinase